MSGDTALKLQWSKEFLEDLKNIKSFDDIAAEEFREVEKLTLEYERIIREKKLKRILDESDS
jgi:hypothetical protein